MKITGTQLRRIMPNLERNLKANRHFRGQTADTVAELMNRYAEEFGITTPLQWVHYLAQVAHESAELRYTEELASGAAYDTGRLAVKLGNTPEKDGDGQKYKGRGLIQLTGRSNYEAYKKYCGYDVVKQPELLAKPVGAIRSSMWFWKTHGLNELADRDDIVAVTKRINGGTNHLYERRNYLTQAKKVIPMI
ncbi:MAG: glycoside hydrolase family 19 protein [Prevotella sp.]|nr:glycoside hydrolase family 19 protein [Prevotella sp.]